MDFSREFADTASAWANLALILSLVVGVVATGVIVIAGNAKERYLKLDLAASNERAGAAEQKAAEAVQRAEAERVERLKLEKQVAPRRLTAEQQRALTNGLSEFKGRAVLVESYALDVEAAILGQQIISALGAAQIQVTDNRMSQASLGGMFLGVSVAGTDSMMVEYLVRSLSSVGLAVTSSPAPLGTGISTGPPRGSATVTVFVGAKPITQ